MKSFGNWKCLGRSRDHGRTNPSDLWLFIDNFFLVLSSALNKHGSSCTRKQDFCIEGVCNKWVTSTILKKRGKMMLSIFATEQKASSHHSRDNHTRQRSKRTVLYCSISASFVSIRIGLECVQHSFVKHQFILFVLRDRS